MSIVVSPQNPSHPHKNLPGFSEAALARVSELLYAEVAAPESNMCPPKKPKEAKVEQPPAPPTPPTPPTPQPPAPAPSVEEKAKKKKCTPQPTTPETAKPG